MAASVVAAAAPPSEVLRGSGRRVRVRGRGEELRAGRWAGRWWAGGGARGSMVRIGILTDLLRSRQYERHQERATVALDAFYLGRGGVKSGE